MKIINKLIVVLLLFTGIFSFASAGEAASSLKDEMNEMVKREIMKGYVNGDLGEKDYVTRAQFAAFISRALDLPEGKHTFKDVKGVRLSAEIAAVYTSGIMQGVSDTSFKPDAFITREQMAQTLKNVLTFTGMKLEEKRVEFVDADDFVSSGGVRAVFNILHYEITKGIPVGTNGDLKFAPKDSTTREQAAAFIYRFLMAKEAATKIPEPVTPEEPKAPEPEFETNTYYIGTVENGKLKAQAEKGHATYESALTAFNANASADAILKGTDIIGVKGGVVFGNHTMLNDDGKIVPEVTKIYSSTDLKTQLTYIEPGREMRFIEATEQYVQVQAGGTIGYVKQEEVDFLPIELVKGQDYYKVVNGELYHYQYNYTSAEQETGYPVGPAPSNMAAGVKYESLDGVHFKPASGAEITHYPYFQYQSVRSKTTYTAKELDRYIRYRLKELSARNIDYKDALTKSKLLEQGEFILEMQEKYNVNALFILAVAMHESQYGMSDKAQGLRNLFGIKVYDNKTYEGRVYDTVQESIEDFAGLYMDSDYVDTWHGEHYNGAVPGNKTTGINVEYASDPAWGSKVAGHMYRADKELGQKDLNKYQLGITNTASTNTVRIEVLPSPGPGQHLYYFARKDLGIKNAFGYPVIIQDSQDGYYQIVSELKAAVDKYNGIGWVLEDYITKIN